MGVKVIKFGGSSVADADQLRKIRTIVEADPERRYIVVSAPGKRHKADNKVTDMLIRCFEIQQRDLDEGLAYFSQIEERFPSRVISSRSRCWLP